MHILTECNLAQIVTEILAGKTIIFPTETSYGLGCDATNQQAVDKIFQIKGRRPDKPLLVVVPTVEMAKKYLVWNETLEKIATQYWPGPVTVVGEYLSLRGAKRRSNLLGIATPLDELGARNDNLADGVVSQDNTVAVRVTKNPLLISITEKMGRPLVATSGNVSDAGDVYDAAVIIDMFKDREYQPDIVLNYGEIPKRPPTTIVGVVGGELKILRQGEITINI